MYYYLERSTQVVNDIRHKNSKLVPINTGNVNKMKKCYVTRVE